MGTSCRLAAVAVLAAAAVLLVAAAAVAKAPAAQGRACHAAADCPAGLTCLARPNAKSTCELVCSTATKCPDDQRCVKDGAQSVCRPVIDL